MNKNIGLKIIADYCNERDGDCDECKYNKICGYVKEAR